MTELVDVMLHLQRFSWPDYLVFVSMLFLCICIGIYFGFIEKSSSESDYLMGGRTMLIFPIALSLIARYIIIILKVMLVINGYCFFCFKFYIWYNTVRITDGSLFIWYSIFIRYCWSYINGNHYGICIFACVS